MSEDTDDFEYAELSESGSDEIIISDSDRESDDSSDGGSSALATTMKIRGIQFYASPESFRKRIYLQNQAMEFFMANLPIHPTYITKYLKINWKYGIPFKDNTDNIVLEYIKSKNYGALKIIIIGAPGVGKTKTAMLLRHLYGIDYLSVENVITAFLADLNSLIQEVRNLLAIESENKTPLHSSQPEVFTLKEICTLSKPLDKFIEIQYPFIEKRARAKTVKQLDLLTLDRGRNYIIKEALENNGHYLDITIAQMFHLRLKDIRLLKQGYVIDDYPKTAEQARKLFPEIPNSGTMKKDPMESEPEHVNKESGDKKAAQPRPDANKCVSQGVAQSSQIAIDFHPKKE